MSSSTDQTRAEAGHAAALAKLRTKKAKVRYACEHAAADPSTSEVLAWLQRYGVVTEPKRERSHVSTIVTAWRRERGLSDTGDVPTMSEDMLAELDALTANTNGADEQPECVHEHANSGSEQHDRSREHANTVSEQLGERCERVHEQGYEHANSTNEQANGAGEQANSRPDGAAGFYVVAFLSLLVSVDTSWRFFGSELGITNVFERAVMFGVVEAALIACGVAMRAAVRREGRPGPARWVAWSLCGLSGYMALVLSGPLAGLARVALGPLLSLVMLHLALGIEVRVRHARVTNWARVRRELRERALSRLGLSDDGRDALAHTRDRAARRAARLAARGVVFRRARLARALRLSNVAHEQHARSRLLAELATAKHADALRKLELPSPWTSGTNAFTNTANEQDERVHEHQQQHEQSEQTGVRR